MSRRVRRAAAIGATVLAVAAAAAPVALATPNVGVTGEVLSTVRVPESVRISTHGPSDLQELRLDVAAHGQVGWHYHPGFVFVSVVSGTATMYMGDDRHCHPMRYHAGEGWLEQPHQVHTVRNETRGQLTLDVVALTPAGQPTGVSVPDPGNCRF